MSELKDLLVEELQDLLSAENQIIGALPEMIEAAHCNKLKEAFESISLKPKAKSKDSINRSNC